MKSFRILFVALMVAACFLTGDPTLSRPAWAENEAKDQPALQPTPGRFKLLPPHKDAAADDMQILDTATGKLYSLQRKPKAKEKEPAYEWMLVADAPK